MSQQIRQGVFFALAAYGLWAIAPVYFKATSHISPFEILSHRIVWSLLLTLIIIAAIKGRHRLVDALSDARTRWYLLVSTCLIGANWGIFIWAVSTDQMLSASLGYYINPLINIFLGMIFFQERLNPFQTVAAGLCIAAVGFEIWQFGRLPWVALVLATTFGLYGLVRKKIGVDSFTGMALETGFLLPAALIYLVFSTSQTASFLDNSISTNLLLALAGPVTMVPLLCFAAAANRISLTALGFFQYIGPSGMFLLAVFVYGEPLSLSKLVTFAIIWTALLILVIDSVRNLRRPNLA
jgi:chloramphenicol-sensitive protein RarD